ncbi:MAG: TIR domain-containing protein [Pseudomonadota bacterium]
MSEAAKSKIFISYSRQDSAFVDDIATGLGAYGGYEVLIDREGIGHGEDWRARLGRLILECDSVVFVLSPDSLASEVCRWEVKEATSLGRRIIPVLWRPIDFADAPAGLSAINAVPFTESQIIRGLKNLVAALDTDMGWLREHTALTERAAEWEAKQEASELLLRGAALRAAQSLLAERPASAPAPMERLQRYIRASEEEETRILSVERERLKEMEAARDAAEEARRREGEAARKVVRRTVAGLVVSLALLAASVAAGAFALMQREEAQTQRAQAVAAAEEARARRDAALIAQSRYLARTAQTFLAGGDAGDAIGLARAALPADLSAPDRPFAIEPVQAISDAYGRLHEIGALRGHTRAVRGATALADGRIATWSRDGAIRFWEPDGRAGRVVAAHRLPDDAEDESEDTGVHGLLTLADGRLLSWGVDKTLKVWSGDGDPLTTLVSSEDWLNVLALSDGRLFVTAGETFRLYGPDLAEIAVMTSADGPSLGASDLGDGRVATTHRAADGGYAATLWRADGAPGARLGGYRLQVLGVARLTGGRIVTWDNEETLKFWSPDGSRLLRTVEQAHGVRINQALALPDGRLYTWGQDAFNRNVWWARLWTPEGEPTDLIEASDAPLDALLLRDGRLLVGTRSQAPQIWSLDGRPGPVLRGHAERILAAEQQADGRIVTMGLDGAIGLWSEDGAPIRMLTGHESAIWGVLTLDGGRLLSFAAEEDATTPRLWSEAATPRTQFPIDTLVRRDGVAALQGGGFSVATLDGAATVWDGEGARVARLGGGSNADTRVLELPDGRLLAWRRNADETFTGPALRFLSAAGAPLGERLEGRRDVVDVFNGTEGRILVFTSGGAVLTLDAEGETLGTVDAAAGDVAYAIRLDDGRFLSVSREGRAQLWGADGAPGAALPETPEIARAIRRTRALEDGRLALLFFGPTSKVFGPDGALVATLESGGSPFGDLVGLSGGRILTVGFDGRIRIFGSEGDLLETREDDTYSADILAVLPDGRFLLQGLETARAFDRTGAPTGLSIDGRLEGATALSGGRLLTWPADADRSLQIWRADGSKGATLRGHTNEVIGALELADGRLLSWTEGAEFRIWLGSVEQAVAWADRVVERLTPLSPRERCAYDLDSDKACERD